MKIRRANRDDIAAYAGAKLPNMPSTKAWVGEVDGEIKAIGGFALVMGRWIAFFDLRPGAERFPVTLARAAKRAMNEMRRDSPSGFIYAELDSSLMEARDFVMGLGFEPDPRTGHLYRWRRGWQV